MPSDELPFPEMIQALTTDPAYRQALTGRLQARAIDPASLERLVVFARSRQTTLGHALARKVLTDAGVSWEAR